MPEQSTNEDDTAVLNAQDYSTPVSTFRQKPKSRLDRCEPYRPDPKGVRTVATFVRFAPTSCFDHECIKVDKEAGTIDIECRTATGTLLCSKKAPPETPMISSSRNFLSFEADMVLQNASQETLFTSTMQDLVDKALDGFSGTVIACGPVGSGKTYTLFSSNEKYQYRGVVSRCIERIYQTLDEWDERTAAVTMSFIEVVGENIHDLLSTKRKRNVTITDNGKIFQLTGMSTERVVTAEAALAALFRGCAQRTTHSHPRNSSGSSTGHAVLCLYIQSRSLVETEPHDRYAELTFCDLAGFEKTRSWETYAHRPCRGVIVDVNKSMTFLEQLIMAMAENRAYIPARLTKLTHILKPKIGSKCDTRLIACLSGEKRHLAETLATLRFAVRLQGVVCDPRQEQIDDPTLMLSKLKKDLTALRQELDMQDMMQKRAPKMHGELSHRERELIQDQVELYLDGQLETLQIVSVKQIEAVLESVRTVQARREGTLRDQLTAELQQQMQQQLQQLQQQLAGQLQPAAAAAPDQRPSLPAPGRERGGRRRASRARLAGNKEAAAEDERSTPADRSSRREERQTSAAPPTPTDQTGPGFGVGVSEGRPNAAAAAALTSRGRGKAAAAGAATRPAAERTSSPSASPTDEPALDEPEVPLPAEPAAHVSSQEALRLLLAAEGPQLAAELERAQQAVCERHEQYAAAARQLRKLRCQQSALQTDLQLLQAERHVQGERYDPDGNIVLSADERQLHGQLRQLAVQLAECQERLLQERRQLAEAQHQQAERRAELTAALADFRLKNNLLPEAAQAAAAARTSSATAASAGVQVPTAAGDGPGTPGTYYNAQRRARAQLRRARALQK